MEQSQDKGSVDCRETDLGDVREETVVGNACGGKPGSHGSQGDTAGRVVGGAIT